jgi:hypothetical protein
MGAAPAAQRAPQTKNFFNNNLLCDRRARGQFRVSVCELAYEENDEQLFGRRSTPLRMMNGWIKPAQAAGRALAQEEYDDFAKEHL